MWIFAWVKTVVSVYKCLTSFYPIPNQFPNLLETHLGMSFQAACLLKDPTLCFLWRKCTRRLPFWRNWTILTLLNWWRSVRRLCRNFKTLTLKTRICVKYEATELQMSCRCLMTLMKMDFIWVGTYLSILDILNLTTYVNKNGRVIKVWLFVLKPSIWWRGGMFLCNSV